MNPNSLRQISLKNVFYMFSRFIIGSIWTPANCWLSRNSQIYIHLNLKLTPYKCKSWRFRIYSRRLFRNIYNQNGQRHQPQPHPLKLGRKRLCFLPPTITIKMTYVEFISCPIFVLIRETNKYVRPREKDKYVRGHFPRRQSTWRIIVCGGILLIKLCSQQSAINNFAK